MWRKLPVPTRETSSAFGREKRARLYADEDIEEDVVDWLRSKGVSVKSARELGHRGKPDSFHAALAARENRFLLTANAKHFLDDRLLPFHKTHGVIAFSSGFRDSIQFGKMVGRLFTIIPYGDFYANTKITVSADGIVIRRISDSGRIVTSRYRLDRGYAYEWV